MELKWGLWQHTRFLRTKMWASNVGGGACLASSAISQQPLPWLTASPPLPSPSLARTAKRIRIKRETCFSLASCSGPMTSPLQPPAPRFQPPSTFFSPLSTLHFIWIPPFYTWLLKSHNLFVCNCHVPRTRLLRSKHKRTRWGTNLHGGKKKIKTYSN